MDWKERMPCPSIFRPSFVIPKERRVLAPPDRTAPSIWASKSPSGFMRRASAMCRPVSPAISTPSPAGPANASAVDAPCWAMSTIISRNHGASLPPRKGANSIRAKFLSSSKLREYRSRASFVFPSGMTQAAPFTANWPTFSAVSAAPRFSADSRAVLKPGRERMYGAIMRNTFCRSSPPSPARQSTARTTSGMPFTGFQFTCTAGKPPSGGVSLATRPSSPFRITSAASDRRFRASSASETALLLIFSATNRKSSGQRETASGRRSSGSSEVPARARS